jgi:predicted DNA-binding transcriptional regulator YafY
MHDETPKRFDRIIAILIQLQSRKVVRAQDLAERFDVSLRTIYRDIRSLESSGVPISSETGVGYSLVGYSALKYTTIPHQYAPVIPGQSTPVYKQG